MFYFFSLRHLQLHNFNKKNSSFPCYYSILFIFFFVLHKINQIFDIFDLSSFYIHVNLFLVFCNSICILRIAYIANKQQKKNNKNATSFVLFCTKFYFMSNDKREIAQFLTLCLLRYKTFFISKFACYSSFFFFFFFLFV